MNRWTLPLTHIQRDFLRSALKAGKKARFSNIAGEDGYMTLGQMGLSLTSYGCRPTTRAAMDKAALQTALLALRMCPRCYADLNPVAFVENVVGCATCVETWFVEPTP